MAYYLVLNSLETAVEKMIENSRKTGTYDENKAIWENDIQGLCSMIQDYVNEYIHYEILNMEELQNELEQQTKQAIKSICNITCLSNYYRYYIVCHYYKICYETY